MEQGNKIITSARGQAMMVPLPVGGICVAAKRRDDADILDGHGILGGSCHD